MADPTASGRKTASAVSRENATRHRIPAGGLRVGELACLTWPHNRLRAQRFLVFERKRAQLLW